LEFLFQFNGYFNKEAIQKILKKTINKAGLETFDESCSKFVQKGLYEKLKPIMVSLIEISRKRQAFQGIGLSNSPGSVIISYYC
jgi:hypothetical protein